MLKKHGGRTSRLKPTAAEQKGELKTTVKQAKQQTARQRDLARRAEFRRSLIQQ